MSTVGRACVLISLLTSSTLAQVETLPIKTSTGNGWWIDDEFHYLTRPSPRRTNSWNPAGGEQNWVHRSDGDLQLSLHPLFNEILLPILKRCINPTQLGALWFFISPDQTLESWFTQSMNEESSRLKSGMLPGITQQEVFNTTGQFSLTRLLTSQPHSALPSSCSYTTATNDQLYVIWEQTFLTGYAHIVRKNPLNHVIGSRLVLLENLIKKEIESAILKIEQLRGGDPIHFHNAFVAYSLQMLFAATGCRPINDPFESIKDFNWDYALVCIDDKSDGEHHGARLVPLAEKAIAQIREEYLPHLHCLSQSLRSFNKELSGQIDNLCNPTVVSPIPLFFFLTEEGEVKHIHPSAAIFQDLFTWQLPPNLFRHFFIQKLLTLGVDSEVVEGWCGHIEQGVSSYGDLSARSWNEDANKYRSSIQNLLFHLGFENVKGWKSPPTIKLPPQKNDRTKHLISNTIFGREARKQERFHRLEKATHETDVIIQEFIAKTNTEELTNDQLNELVNSVLYSGRRKQHVKHLIAHRFNHLVNWLEQTQGNDENLTWQIKKHAGRFQTTKSPISTDTPKALDTFRQLEDQVSITLEQTYPSQIGATSALHLSAISLGTNNRISYARLLKDISKGKNFRLIRYHGQCYLEYSESLEISNIHCPVQRLAITPKLAALLDKGLSVNTNYSKRTQSNPQLLYPFQTLLGLDKKVEIEQLIESLSIIIDQANAVELSGLMTGTLSGRIPTTSLSICDWIRTKKGQRLEFTSCTEFSNAESTLSNCHDVEVNFEQLLSQAEGNEIELNARDRAQEAAKEYTKLVKAIIKEYTTKNAKRTASLIREAHLTLDHSPCSTVLALGDWIADRILAGKRNKDPLQLKSVKNYYSTLSTGFQGLAYDLDTHSLDPDELTELYEELLDSRTDKYGDSLQYFKDRLVEFHQFAATKFHIPSPYWADIEIEETGRSVSPGYISEAEYFTVLQNLKATMACNSQIERDFACFITILGFRYGLRRKEALLLRRLDITEVDNQFFIHVQGYRGHRLKSKSSRRIVPPLEPLMPEERDIIQSIMDHYEVHFGQVRSKGIIRILPEGEISVLVSKIPALVISLLKRVTGNPRMVFHHFRHSFLNRVSAGSLGISSPFTTELYGSFQSQSLRRKILGPNSEISRRLPMAIARLMGHYSPKTSLRSYNHILTDLIDQSLGPFKKSNQKLSNTIELDECKIIGAADPISIKDKPVQFTPVTLHSMLDVMFYVAQGSTAERASQLLNLPPHIAESFMRVIKQASKMLWFKLYQGGRVKGEKAPEMLLSRIYSTAWKRMLDHASSISPEYPIEYPDLSRLPLLIGQTRQIILQDKPDFKLIKFILDNFDINPDNYRVLARGNDQEQQKLADDFGFEIATGNIDETTNSILIDNLRDPEVLYQREYLALELIPGSKGPLRNRSDLVVAFLAAGLALNLSASSNKPAQITQG